MTNASEQLFWRLAAALQRQHPRIQEGTIMNGRCLRLGNEFLALVDYKDSGLVVKLPKSRVEELVHTGVGQPFAPAGRIFKEWLSVPKPDPVVWRTLLREGIAFVGGAASDGNSAHVGQRSGRSGSKTPAAPRSAKSARRAARAQRRGAG